MASIAKRVLFKKFWVYFCLKKRLRKQKTGSEGNLSRFFCF